VIKSFFTLATSVNAIKLFFASLTKLKIARVFFQSCPVFVGKATSLPSWKAPERLLALFQKYWTRICANPLPEEKSFNLVFVGKARSLPWKREP